MNVIAWISIAVAVGAIIACVAHTRGRSFALWWAYGSLLGVVALPHLLLMRDLSSERRWTPVRYGLPVHDQACPFCGMPVHEAALVCRHCRQAVDPEVRRNGWQPFSEPARASGSGASARKAGPAPSAAGIEGLTVGWSMAGYAGVSPISSTTDAGATRMYFRRRTSDSPAPSSFADDASGPGKSPQGGTSRNTGPGPVYPDAERSSSARRAGSTDAAGARPFAEVRSGAARTGHVPRRRRDAGTLPPSAVAAALAACVGAALFVTPAWRYGAEVVSLVSPAKPDDAFQSSDVRPDTAADLSKNDMLRRQTTGQAGTSDADPATSPDPPASAQQVAPVVSAVSREPADASAAPLNDATGDGAVPPDAENIPTSTDKVARLGDATSPVPKPDPQPMPASSAAPEISKPAANEAAQFAAAAPKVRPQRQPGFDAEAQANLDAVIERLERQAAASPKLSTNRKTAKSADISATGEVVYELQQKLKARGFDPGGVDGQFGPQTRRALKAFQRKSGMPPTGEIDKQVLIAFGLIS